MPRPRYKPSVKNSKRFIAHAKVKTGQYETALSKIIRGLNVKSNLPMAFGFSSDGLRPLPSNPSTMFNLEKDKRGGSLTSQMMSSVTITIAAAALQRGISYTDIDGTVQASCSDKNEFPRYAAFEHHLVFTSASVFAVTPFVVLLENGESLSAVDANSADILATFESMIGANSEYIAAFGPTYQGSLTTAASSPWHSRVDFDITDIANAYSKHYAKKELEEENALVLRSGFIATGANNQTISVVGGLYTCFHLEPRTWGGL